MWNDILQKINLKKTPQKAVQFWGGDICSLKLINHGINVVYRFKSRGEVFYLKITHQKLRNKKAITASVDFLRHLYEKGASVCEPMQSKRGKWVEEVKQGNHIFLASVIREVKGKPFHFKKHDQKAYFAWGKALAKMHCAAKTYKPKVKYKFLTFKNIQTELKKYLNQEDEVVQKEFKFVSQWIKILRKTKNKFGLTHSDNRSENIIVHGSQAFIIDFDEPVYHWFTADIARPFLEFHGKPKKELKKFIRYYLKGYESVLLITEKEKKNFAYFMRFKNLELYLWIKNNWAGTKTSDGKGKEKLLNTLYGWIKKPISFE